MEPVLLRIKCMKIRFLAFMLCLFLILCALITIPTFAHSGGTDSKGGHYDNSTGKYHYHHGYSAHQHKDGVCPYEKKNSPKKANDDSNIWKIIAIVAALIIVILTILCIKLPKFRSRLLGAAKPIFSFVAVIVVCWVVPYLMMAYLGEAMFYLIGNILFYGAIAVVILKDKLR